MAPLSKVLILHDPLGQKIWIRYHTESAGYFSNIVPFILFKDEILVAKIIRLVILKRRGM